MGPQESKSEGNDLTDITVLLSDRVFNLSGYIFAIFLICGPIVVMLIDYFQNTTTYQSTMLFIGWNQAIITAYLSFKIFEISKRDSELPNIVYELGRVEELETPDGGHRVVRCTVEIHNHSYGRAKITDIELSSKFNQKEVERNKKSEGGIITTGFPEGKNVPLILDKGEKSNIVIQINGFTYLDELSVITQEATLGTIERWIPISEISDRLLITKESKSQDLE